MDITDLTLIRTALRRLTDVQLPPDHRDKDDLQDAIGIIRGVLRRHDHPTVGV